MNEGSVATLMAPEKDPSSETHFRPWASLPVQALEVIKSKLYSSNLIRFKAVCKRWQENGNKLRPISNLPWPAGHSCETRITCEPPKFEMEFKIYDPHEGNTHKTCFDVPESSSYLSYNEDLQHLSRVYASRNGWVLVEEESPVGSRAINLYSPFANRTFPSPANYGNFQLSAATFSSAPTSPDCILFVAFRCNLGSTYIGTYQYANDNWDWTIHEIIRDGGDPLRTVKSMVYCEAESRVYFVSEDGTLGTFDFLEKTHRIYEDTAFCYPIDSIHLVEYEGDIILALGIADQDSDRYSWDGHEWMVSKFNRDATSWVSDGLQGRTLFVSEASFCVAIVGNLEACVCSFFNGKFWRIYSLRDHGYVPAENFGWIAEGVGEKSFWIEPPLLEI